MTILPDLFEEESNVIKQIKRQVKRQLSRCSFFLEPTVDSQEASGQWRGSHWGWQTDWVALEAVEQKSQKLPYIYLAVSGSFLLVTQTHFQLNSPALCTFSPSFTFCRTRHRLLRLWLRPLNWFRPTLCSDDVWDLVLGSSLRVWLQCCYHRTVSVNRWTPCSLAQGAGLGSLTQVL